MFTLIGIIIVLAAVIGGFVVENGPIRVLFQPAEFMIIFGAVLGAFCIGSSRSMFGQVLRSIRLIVSMRYYSRANYLELLHLLSILFIKMRKEGVASIERDVEHPQESILFSHYPLVTKDPAVVLFICDTLRVFITTGDQGELEKLMKLDMDAMLDQAEATSTMISKMAESMPGLGIVAAVLGVILTMGQISQPPEVLGRSIGAALVGTFLGVLFCYGFVGPMAIKLENLAQERNAYFNVIKAAISAAVSGTSPVMAVEYGRRAIPEDVRPTFFEMEESLRGR
ncbi:MAG: flagellar motor stator protein MotA [Desulfovibrio sp.]|jgi:chemotaxis protein MotA|nr:flagellar motor stator protein MotA [Desulfovibrio sp.]